jgi:hypothetical protein
MEFPCGNRLVQMICSLALLQACAYSVARQELKLISTDGEIRNYDVFIPVFDNRSARSNASEAVITDAFRNRWARVSNVKLSGSDAELVLLGKIKRWELTGGKDIFTGTPATQAYGGLSELQSAVANMVLTVVIELQLLRKVGGIEKVEWSKELKGSKTFEAYNRLDEASGSSSAPLIHESRERIALRRLAEDLANNSIESFQENF